MKGFVHKKTINDILSSFCGAIKATSQKQKPKPSVWNVPQACTLKITPLFWESVTSLGGLHFGLASLFYLLHRELAFIFILCRVHKHIITSLIPYQQNMALGNSLIFLLKPPLVCRTLRWSGRTFQMHEASGWEIWRDCSHAWQVCVQWCVHRWVKCIGEIQKHYLVCVQIVLSLFILSFIYHDGPLLPPINGKVPHENPPIVLNPIRKQSTKRRLPPGSWHAIC